MLIHIFLLQAAVVVDSLQTEANVTTPSSFGGVIDVLYKLSMVAIALFNVFYVIRLNKIQNQDKQSQRQTERRMDLLKTIVLIPNIKKMYKFLDNLWIELEKLKLEGENEKNSDKENTVKKEIEPIIQSQFSTFRSDFIIALNATTPSLGNKIEQISDTMRDTLLENMADPGINLWVANYFNDKIKSVFEKGKMDLLNALFNYNGE